MICQSMWIWLQYKNSYCLITLYLITFITRYFTLFRAFKMSQTFLLEPDIIAATENVMPDLNTDLVLAKNYLKQQSAATGDSV